MAKSMEQISVKNRATRIVRLDALSHDPSYQREPIKAAVRAMAADWIEAASAGILVAQREDDSLWIVDGLQRISAMRTMGLEEARVDVFRSESIEQESAIFVIANKRTKLKPHELFKARLVAHDELAWAIKEAVEDCGYAVDVKNCRGSKSCAEPSLLLACINTILKEVARNGVESLKFALNVIKMAWPGDKDGSSSNMVAGMCVFHRKHDGVVDMERLMPRLRATTAQRILYTAAKDSLGGKIEHAVASEIEKVYHKRQPRQRK